MVSSSKTAYTPPAAVSSSGSPNSHDETPIITISEKDIRVVLDKDDDKPVPPFERNSYKLERDPCLNGRRKPTNLAFCPHCTKENVRTRTKTYPNSTTWGCAALGAIIFFPLGIIPLVSDSMKKTDHYCQNCGQKLATIKPFAGVGVNERS
ncbi:MAG: hypothetical protein SGBAC_007294 [Bacillariaceae sp.]